MVRKTVEKISENEIDGPEFSPFSEEKPGPNGSALAALRLPLLFRFMLVWLKRLGPRSRWKEFVLLASATMFCLCLWGFIELAEDAPEGDYQQVEERIMRALRQPNDPSQPIGPAWTFEASRDITALGGATVLVLMTAVVIGYLLLRRAHGAAVLVLVATLGGYLLSYTLKNAINRPRPQIIPHLAPVVSASFPSGHSMLSSVVYLTLGALLARTVAQRREKIYCIAVALFLTILIGFSRVYLGVHYPTDVLAGWSAGTAWALLCWCATYLLQRGGAVEDAATGTKEQVSEEKEG